MDVIKKKHWWQSDALKWSVLGLLGLLVGYLVVLMTSMGFFLIPGRIRLSYLIRQQLPDATLTRLIRPTYVSIS